MSSVFLNQSLGVFFMCWVGCAQQHIMGFVLAVVTARIPWPPWLP
jgi:hypothetical protein